MGVPTGGIWGQGRESIQDDRFSAAGKWRDLGRLGADSRGHQPEAQVPVGSVRPQHCPLASSHISVKASANDMVNRGPEPGRVTLQPHEKPQALGSLP